MTATITETSTYEIDAWVVSTASGLIFQVREVRISPAGRRSYHLARPGMDADVWVSHRMLVPASREHIALPREVAR